MIAGLEFVRLLRRDSALAHAYFRDGLEGLGHGVLRVGLDGREYIVFVKPALRRDEGHSYGVREVLPPEGPQSARYTFRRPRAPFAAHTILQALAAGMC